MDEGDSSGEEGARIQPAAAQAADVSAKKDRFVDTHLADTQKAADELGVPVENILAASALETQWGEHRFAAQGNNYFGIHYPAPFANGYLLSRGGIKVATFASYAESLQSFVKISGSVVKDKTDPTEFAALQDSGKFGIEPDGSKRPTYVHELVSIVRGLRPFVARRRV
jgi:Mannosyl-glycoprotein endo-beta-N-acetylglucosaminidase